MPAPTASSLIDRVDEADRYVGKVARGDVFKMHAGFRVAHVFVFNEQGELLLQQLGRKRERNPLRWGSSVAGYLNAGEDYFDGARRRLGEELGLATPLIKFGSVAMQDQGAHKFIALYFTLAPSDVKVAEPDHIEKLRFESPRSIRARVTDKPEVFTETFLFLFGFCLSTVRVTGWEEWMDAGAPPVDWGPLP
jgi:isopentenyl-diphosphate delta-isomerase